MLGGIVLRLVTVVGVVSLVAISKMGCVMSGLVVVDRLLNDVLDAVLLMFVTGNNSCVLVVSGTRLLMVLDLDVGFLLMVLLVMGVLVVRSFNMDGVVVDNARFVVELFVVGGKTLDVVVGALVVVFIVSVLVVVAIAIAVMDGLLAVASVVSLVVRWQVLSVTVFVMNGFVNDNSLMMDSLVMNGNNNSLMKDSLVMNGLVNNDSILSDIGFLLLVCTFVIVVRFVVMSIVLVGVIILVGSVVASSMFPDNIIISVLGGREVVHWDIVFHLTSKEDLRERKADGVTELIEVLVLPLSLSIHNLVMDVLSIDDEIMLNMEDEVPRVCESLGHFTELVKISADGSLALFEFVSNIVDNMAHILNSVEHRVEGTVLELIDDTTESLPDVLGITEALNTVRNLSLNRASEKTLEDLTHAEEGEMNI